MAWCSSSLELAQFLAIVYNDPLTEFPPDAIYVFGHTPDNEEPPVRKAAELWKKFRCPILLGGSSPYHSPITGILAYNGGRAWKDRLIQLSVPREDIVLLSQPELAHTHTEALAFVGWLLEHGARSAAIVFLPQHFRAMADVISVLIQKGAVRISLSAHPTSPLPWGEVAAYSQGEQGLTRFETITHELGRLDRYHAKGDLISAGECIEYLLRREGRC